MIVVNYDPKTESVEFPETLEGLHALVNAKAELVERIAAYTDQRFDDDPEWNKDWFERPSMTVSSIGMDEVCVKFSARSSPSGCCGYKDRYFWFPLSKLLGD